MPFFRQHIATVGNLEVLKIAGEYVVENSTDSESVQQTIATPDFYEGLRILRENRHNAVVNLTAFELATLIALGVAKSTDDPDVWEIPDSGEGARQIARLVH